MRIENLHWDANRIWIPEGKTEKARRFVAMSERTKSMLRQWCGERKEGWIFPSSRSKSGHLTTIAKGFQAARDRVGLDRKLVPYSLGTPMEHTRWRRAATRSPSPGPWAMLTSGRWSRTKHQELEPLREVINQRNERKKFGQVFENDANRASRS